MKTIITALMLISTTAFAQMTTLPVMPRLAYEVLKIDQVSQEVRSISVDSIGNVTVAPRFNRSLHIFKLSPTNKSEILNHAQYLSNVETVTHTSEIVCMMMPNPNTVRILTLRNEDTGEYREILSPRGCSYTSVTLPKDEYSQQLAENIVSNLIMIVNQKLNI